VRAARGVRDFHQLHGPRPGRDLADGFHGTAPRGFAALRGATRGRPAPVATPEIIAAPLGGHNFARDRTGPSRGRAGHHGQGWSFGRGAPWLSWPSPLSTPWETPVPM